jgi:hypothetical protein
MRRAAAATAVVATLGMFIAACGGGSSVAVTSRPLPSRLTPPSLGDYTFKEEPAAEAVYRTGGRDGSVIVEQGRVFSLRYQQVVEGDVQFARFKPGYSAGDQQVVDAIQSTIGGFHPLPRSGVVPVWVAAEPDQHIYLWFPAGSDAMALLVVRDEVGPATGDALVRALVAYGAGRSPAVPRLAPPSRAPAPAATPILDAGGSS